jgi:hypothetical protein
MREWSWSLFPENTQFLLRCDAPLFQSRFGYPWQRNDACQPILYLRGLLLRDKLVIKSLNGWYKRRALMLLREQMLGYGAPTEYLIWRLRGLAIL